MTLKAAVIGAGSVGFARMLPACFRPILTFQPDSRMFPATKTTSYGEQHAFVRV